MIKRWDSTLLVKGNVRTLHAHMCHPSLPSEAGPSLIPFLLFVERVGFAFLLAFAAHLLLFCVAAMATSYGEGFLDLDLITDHNVHRALALARPLQPANFNSHSSAQQQQQDDAVSEEPELHDEPPATTSCHPQQQGTATLAFIHLPIFIAQFCFPVSAAITPFVHLFVRSDSGGTMPQGVVVFQPRARCFYCGFFFLFPPPPPCLNVGNVAGCSLHRLIGFPLLCSWSMVIFCIVSGVDEFMPLVTGF